MKIYDKITGEIIEVNDSKKSNEIKRVNEIVDQRIHVHRSDFKYHNRMHEAVKAVAVYEKDRVIIKEEE